MDKEINIRRGFREVSTKLSSNQLIRPFVILAGAIIIGSLISPHFLRVDNLLAILIAASPLILLAVGEALVMMTGMIDLSGEAVLASAGVVMASLDIMVRLPTYMSIILTLVFGALIGLINGFLVAKARIPSFIVTLGFFWGLRGLALIINKGFPVTPSFFDPPRPFSFSGIAGNIYGIPVMVVIAIVVGVLIQIYISNFRKGIDIYAVGGNEVAAKNCGINVISTKIFVFVMAGILGALAGIIMTAWINQGYAWTAQGFTLQAVAAVVLGGIPLIGGYGTIIGAIIGAIVIAMISDIIVLLGILPTYNYVVVAAVLIIAGLQVREKKSRI